MSKTEKNFLNKSQPYPEDAQCTRIHSHMKLVRDQNASKAHHLTLNCILLSDLSYISAFEGMKPIWPLPGSVHDSAWLVEDNHF